VGLVLQTQSPIIASTNFCCSQLLIQFIVNNTVDFYLSFFFCICVLAFVCLSFLVNNISYIPTETNFVPFESELLLRSELSVVTLGKSLPGNCSKLGQLFPGA